jgi:hypothetical protein
MNEHLETILKLVEQMECGDRLVPETKDVGFLEIETIIVRGVIQDRNIPETEKAEE